MPVGNKRGFFKNNSAKFLAEKYNIPAIGIISSGKYITEKDVQWMIDNINYDKYGVAIFNKLNVPKEKRYDTDGVAYTLIDFKNFYNKNYKIHWNNAHRYIPIYDVI